MNPEPDDLRRLVRAARASGKDDHDPEIAEALEALRQHPELLRELEAERRDDLEVAAEFQSQEPPDQLEAHLLETLRVTRRHFETESSATEDTSETERTWSRRHWLGLAATVAASTGGLLWWRSTQQLSIDTLTDRLATISNEGVELSLMSMVKQDVVGWLLENQAPRAATLPAALDALGRKGCHIYTIEDRRVSLECFLLPGMLEIHLFSTPSSGLAGEPGKNQPPTFTRNQDLTTAIWSGEEQTMILLTEAPEDRIRPLLVSV